MKLKVASVRSKAKPNRYRRKGNPQKLPSFAAAAKRVAGMIEGSHDLSMREGFGPKLLR